MTQPFPSDLKALTSLRFIAALWVVVFHFLPYVGLNGGEFPLFDKGYLGVDFFFILSGFILAHVYRAPLMAGTYSHFAFLQRRVARIYPMHVTMLAFFVVLALAAPRLGLTMESAERYDFSKIPEQLLMVHAWWSPGSEFNYPSWSISAEFFAYICFPVVMLLSRRPWLMVIAGLVAVFGWYVLAYQLTGRVSTHQFDGALMRIMPEFLLGAGLREVMDRRRVWLAGHVWSLPAAAVLTITLACFAAPDWTILAGLILVVVCGAERARSERVGLLEHQANLYLGEISYALYMVHVAVGMAFFFAAEKLFGVQTTFTATAALLLVASLIASTLIAAAAERLIERPGRRLIASLGRRRSRVTARG